MLGGEVLDEGYSQTNSFCIHKNMICINFGRGQNNTDFGVLNHLSASKKSDFVNDA